MNLTNRLICSLLTLLMSAGLTWAAVTRTVNVATTNVPNGPVAAIVITPGNQVETRFPTVYLLNGYGGNHKTWFSVRSDFEQLSDRYGMIFVMPDGRNSWFWDCPAMPEMKMETFFMSDLIPYIDSNFPTKPKREFRAVTGLSMGGQGALHLAAHNPFAFAHVGSTSGGVDIRQFPNNWGMKNLLGPITSYPERWDAIAIVNVLPAVAPGLLNIIIDCGTDDFFYDVNLDLHKRLLEAKVPHDYICRPGAHDATYWANSILYQLLYFHEAFVKAAKAESASVSTVGSADENWDVRGETGCMVIDSRIATNLVLSDLSGRSRTISVSPGVNSYSLSPGFYVIDSRKILVK